MVVFEMMCNRLYEEDTPEFAMIFVRAKDLQDAINIAELLCYSVHSYSEEEDIPISECYKRSDLSSKQLRWLNEQWKINAPIREMQKKHLENNEGELK